MTTFNFNTLCAGRSLTTEESQALFTQAQTPGDAPSPGTPAGARANLAG